MACLSPEDVLQHLIEVDDGNLDSLPEVQAMRQILVRNPEIDRDSVSKLCVGAQLVYVGLTANPRLPKRGTSLGRVRGNGSASFIWSVDVTRGR